MTLRSRIAIVEHNGLVRRGLAQLLDEHPPVHVVAVAAEPARLSRLPLDVVVYGPSAADEDDLDAAVRRLASRGRVLVLAEFARPGLVSEAIRAGAYGCVTRQTEDSELLRAVGAVASGSLHIGPELAGRLGEELREPEPEPARNVALPPREAETLRLLAAGLTHGQIARRMTLTETTVSTYVKRIRGKLGAGNKAELTRIAIELGLVPADVRPGATNLGPVPADARPAPPVQTPERATVRHLPRAFSA